MGNPESITADVVRWDTFSNKIYFNVDSGSLDGRLILKRDASGKIGLFIVRTNQSTPLRQSS
jgi:hypothetical protein